jgi:phosphotriesterase-related protein
MGSLLSVVHTVGGVKSPTDLGATLMHEHVFVVSAEVADDYPDIGWGDKARQMATAKAWLDAAKAAGIDTIVDLTVLGAGRRVRELEELQAQIEINLIVGTGYYTYDELPAFAANRRLRDPSKLVGDSSERILEKLFVRDIAEGIPGTGVKAAILKCATDEQGLTPGVEAVLTATARAHRATGAPISTHTSPEHRTGIDQQNIFTKEGVDLTRVIIGHCGETTDMDYLRRLLDNGSFIGFDRFGYNAKRLPTLQQRVDALARLCDEGYAGQIVLSHDAVCYSDRMDASFKNVFPDWTYTYVPTRVLPALRERGVSEAHIEQMMVANPRRIFEQSGGY